MGTTVATNALLEREGRGRCKGGSDWSRRWPSVGWWVSLAGRASGTTFEKAINPNYSYTEDVQQTSDGGYVACAGSAHQGRCRRAAGPGGVLARTGLFHRFFLGVAAAFATRALSRSILFRQGRTVTAGAAAGGLTLLGALMAGGCFLIGCCGSPMLAVYLSLMNRDLCNSRWQTPGQAALVESAVKTRHGDIVKRCSLCSQGIFLRSYWSMELGV
jgi:hypothetical protein